MKKTLNFIFLSLIVLPAFSQKETMHTGAPPPKELTINGKPYNQYKAEQDALKMQAATVKRQTNPVAAPTAPPAFKPVVANGGDPAQQINAARVPQPQLVPDLADQKDAEIARMGNEMVNNKANHLRQIPALVTPAAEPPSPVIQRDVPAEKTTKQAGTKKPETVNKVWEQKPLNAPNTQVLMEQDVKNLPAETRAAEAPVKLEKAPPFENNQPAPMKSQKAPESEREPVQPKQAVGQTKTD